MYDGICELILGSGKPAGLEIKLEHIFVFLHILGELYIKQTSLLSYVCHALSLAADNLIAFFNSLTRRDTEFLHDDISGAQ